MHVPKAADVLGARLREQILSGHLREAIEPASARLAALHRSEADLRDARHVGAYCEQARNKAPHTFQSEDQSEEPGKA